MKTVFVFITSKYCRVPGKLREPPAFGRKKGRLIRKLSKLLVLQWSSL